MHGRAALYGRLSLNSSAFLTSLPSSLSHYCYRDNFLYNHDSIRKILMYYSVIIKLDSSLRYLHTKPKSYFQKYLLAVRIAC
jgi:hypothetical protein